VLQRELPGKLWFFEFRINDITVYTIRGYGHQRVPSRGVVLDLKVIFAYDRLEPSAVAPLEKRRQLGLKLDFTIFFLQSGCWLWYKYS
jgi:hypothetical protein